MEEALYVVRFTFRGVPNQGVVVLETNRIFGGDSAYYYVGSYQVKDSRVTGSLEIIHHNPLIPSIFGPLERFSATIDVVVNGNMATGTLLANGMSVPIELEKKEILP